MEEEYDSFKVDDTDLEYALNPGARRFRQTKEQQTYGIWADNDDYDSRPSFGKKASKPSGPVRFVSGGVAMGSKKEDEEIIQPGPSREELDDDVVEISLIPEKKARRAQFGGKNKVGSNAFAGMRGPGAEKGSSSKEASANWASSTVMKMMKNMGWQEGKGLGEKGQGIVEPVQAILRPGRGAVGAYGNETKGLKFGETAGAAQRRGVEFDDDSFEDRDIEEARRNSWKKSHAGKVKPRYTTLEELVHGDRELDPPKIVQKATFKIIDMTGPQEKVYDNFQSYQEQISVEKAQAERRNFNVPALSDNLNYLVLSCRNEIFSNNDHLQDLKNKTSGLERDKVEIEQYVEEATENLGKVEGVLDLVKRFDNPTSDGLNILDEYREIFRRIKTNYPAEYLTFGLDCLVDFKVLPLVKQLFSKWNPLNPQTIDQGLNQLREWRFILASNKDAVFDDRYDSDKGNVYDVLLRNGWLPVVQRALTRWDPRTNSVYMIEFVATWLPVLPANICDAFLENAVIPKIRETVEEWDPINDEIPIDSWMIPWHDILGDRLLNVYAQIRQKLSKALRNWQSTDLTALAVLKPWKSVFSHSAMQTFLNMNIVPKLEQGLRQMNLNPSVNKEYNEFYAVLEWRDLLSTELICDVLVNAFFQRWYENLCRWLTLPNSLNDVPLYYKEWKDRVPAELAQMKPIHAEFIRALMAIKQAREGIPIAPMPSFGESQVIHVPIAQPPKFNPVHPQFIPTSFKQLVEHRARELGIVFAPQPNRFHNGRIIYWFGGKSVYIDGTALFSYDTINGIWLPISLEHFISSL